MNVENCTACSRSAPLEQIRNYQQELEAQAIKEQKAATIAADSNTLETGINRPIAGAVIGSQINIAV